MRVPIEKIYPSWKSGVGDKMQLLLLILIVLAGFVMGQVEGDNRADAPRVMALETLWKQAELNRDVRAMSQIVADTFTYVDLDGSLKDKAEFLKNISSGEEVVQEIKNESTVARTYANTVIVNGIYRERGRIRGKTYSRRARFTDTWVNVDSAWLCVASQSTLIEK